MEDAHTHILSLPGDQDTCFFGVFDGHGGQSDCLFSHFFCIFITVFMMLLFHEKLVGTCTLHMFTVMQLKLHINIHKLLIQLLFYFWQWHWSWHKGSNEGVCWWLKTGWSQATGWQSLLCAALVGWQTGHMSHKNNATCPQKNKWRKKTGGIC